VSVSWGEDDSPVGARRYQFEVSECVETKTITTTTTTKRTFPPVYVREPRPLASLDAKEYPLASKPTPPELAQFSFDVPGFDMDMTDVEAPPPLPARQVRSDATIALLDVDCCPSASPVGMAGQANTHQQASKRSVESRMEAAQSRLARSPSEVYSRRARRHARDSPAPLNISKTSKSRSASGPLNAVSDKLRRSIAPGRRDGDRLSRHVSAGLLTTPDAESSRDRSRPRSLHLERLAATTPDSGLSQSTAYDIATPLADSPTAFGGTAATPPITDADIEPFADADETLQQSIRSLQQSRLAHDVAAAQDADASLPSPRLSPNLAATQPAGDDDDDVDELEEDSVVATAMSGPVSANSSYMEESHLVMGADRADEFDSQGSSTALVLKSEGELARRSSGEEDMSRMLDPRAILDSFDAMPADMQTLMMYQLLRRCPRKTLRVVADVVNPSLQCDFLKQLPLELSYSVLSYLDHRDLCRAAQVSKHWRNLVDSNERGWKELFDRDGFRLPPNELDRAIKQGWGWQDPYGPMGCEADLSAQKRLNSTEAELTKSVVKTEQSLPKLRSSKRKRPLNSLSGAERSKRRAVAQDAKDGATAPGSGEAKQHKSEGPLSAANAAAMAVPDPQMGLPSLRKLHLFKSLYRRHYMIRQNWTSGRAPPSHVAFTAHPRNVITCLQFDEDKIITGSDDTFIHIYDTQTGKLRKKLEGHEGGVWALQYEGNVLVSGSTDRSVRVWDIEKGLCTQVFYGHTSTVRCLQILMPSMVAREHAGQPEMLPAKPLIITGSRDNQLRVWRLPEAGSRRYIQTGPPANDSDCPYFIRTLVGHTHSVRAIAAHGDTLVSGSYDSTVRVWRISTGEARHVLHGHTQKVYSVVLDHERNRCISGAMDSLVKIWDLATGACLHNLEGHSLLVGILGLRDERLVSAAADSTLRIWDPENGKCKNVLTAHTGAITCFQHDGQKVISGSEKTVKMWDIGTGNCIQDLLTELGGVWQVKFDDRRCVAAVQRQQITYIEVSGGRRAFNVFCDMLTSSTDPGLWRRA